MGVASLHWYQQKYLPVLKLNSFLFLSRSNLRQNYEVDEEYLHWDSISTSVFFSPLSPLLSEGMDVHTSVRCNFSLGLCYHSTTLKT